MKCYVSDKERKLSLSNVDMSAGSAGEMNQVKFYPGKTYQTILGMGGALTEASAYTYSLMSDAKKKELIDLYFGDNSNKYNLCRLHIQSSDFSLGNYAYIEDKDDKELKTFNMERDLKYIVPFVKDALVKDPAISFIASPWSPPAFMKSNGDMNHGGKLLSEYNGMWADIIVRFLKEYEALGIKIERLTVQNEPAAVQTWDSCIYSGEEEGMFAVNYLRPALDKAGYKNVKINIWDHNKEIIVDRADASFSVEGADEAISGIAFHWYSGDHFESLARVREDYPDKELIFTEGCVEYSIFKSDDRVQFAEKYAHDILGDFLAGGNAFVDWNVILDKKGGPNHVGNFCDAPVMCDYDNDVIDVKLSYYYIGHFSRFIKPGAKRALVSRFTSDIEAVGFVNPDGEKVMVVLNRTEKDVAFTVFDGEKNADVKSESHSIMTLVW